MCDHCRSAIARTAAVPGVQEKAPVLDRTRDGNRIASTGQHVSAKGRIIGACCGVGCCEGAKLISSCCGTRREDVAAVTIARSCVAELRDQTRSTGRPRSPNRARCSDDNFVGTTRMAPSSPCPVFGTVAVLDSANCFANSINASRSPVPGYSESAGVCPAIMRNLPCTSYRESKCYGGDCCDEEDPPSRLRHRPEN